MFHRHQISYHYYYYHCRNRRCFWTMSSRQSSQHHHNMLWLVWDNAIMIDNVFLSILHGDNLLLTFHTRHDILSVHCWTVDNPLLYYTRYLIEWCRLLLSNFLCLCGARLAIFFGTFLWRPNQKNKIGSTVAGRWSRQFSKPNKDKTTLRHGNQQHIYFVLIEVVWITLSFLFSSSTSFDILCFDQTTTTKTKSHPTLPSSYCSYTKKEIV